MKFNTKHKLKFRPDGTFRVLMMSDLQESPQYDPRSLRSVEVLLEEGDPDLVILGGDNCNGPEINSEEELKAFLNIFTEPLEKRGIPWAHVFGNHDHHVVMDLDKHQALYEAFPMCVSSHTGADVDGKTNFVLPIYNKNDEIALAVWGLDTNCDMEHQERWIEECRKYSSTLPIEINTETNPVGYWGMLGISQLQWYLSTSIELEKLAGKKVPSLMCMHVPPYEFRLAQNNPSEYVIDGHIDEEFNGMALDPGIFKLLLHRGDVKAICCGHTHRNDFSAQYSGIKLFWDACCGYRCYGVDERRGGRLFIFNEDAPTEFKSCMLHSLAGINI